MKKAMAGIDFGFFLAFVSKAKGRFMPEFL